MALNNLTDLLKAVITDLYTAERQMSEFLQRLYARTETEELKDEIKKRIDETRGHVTRLDEICEQLDMHPRPEDRENSAIRGLISEADQLIEGGKNEAEEAALIYAMQCMIHYKMAGYGSAREYAFIMNEKDTADLLGKTVDEEKKADARLTEVAVNMINKKALEAR